MELHPQTTTMRILSCLNLCLEAIQESRRVRSQMCWSNRHGGAKPDDKPRVSRIRRHLNALMPVSRHGASPSGGSRRSFGLAPLGALGLEGPARLGFTQRLSSSSALPSSAARILIKVSASDRSPALGTWGDSRSRRSVSTAKTAARSASAPRPAADFVSSDGAADAARSSDSAASST